LRSQKGDSQGAVIRKLLNLGVQKAEELGISLEQLLSEDLQKEENENGMSIDEFEKIEKSLED
jgi:hypothetical protein